MPGNPSPNPVVSTSPPARDTRLRYRAVPFLVLVLAEILVGNQLAVVSSPYPVGYLAAHVGLSIALIVWGGYLVVTAYQMRRVLARVLSGLCFGPVVIATLSGTVFLLGGGSQAALYAMEGFGGLAFLGSILLILWGSFPSSGPTSGTA